MGKHERLKGFAKRIVNPLMLKFAGKRNAPISVIYHVGRRSGKLFETPIIVKPVRGGFVIALTYGADVDWYRNLTAAGGGALLWHGRKYAIEQPYPIDNKQALELFLPPLRMILRLNHVDDFVLVKRRAVNAAR